MALVGQIVTVSDVLMDGTVNNYIMGADANVFQTNYNSSGVMTNWSIGDNNKYLRCVETGLQGKFGDNSIQYSSFRLDQNYFRLVTNVAGTPNDHPCYFIAGNTGLNNNVVLGYWDGEGDPDESNGALLINLGNSVLMGQSVHCIASNYCFIGTTCGSQQIQWSNAGRPYFGYNETNYVVSKTDLDTAISTGTSGMATQTWVQNNYQIKGNYQPAGSYAAAVHSHNYQLPLPTNSATGAYTISTEGYSKYLYDNSGQNLYWDSTQSNWRFSWSVITLGNFYTMTRSTTIDGIARQAGLTINEKGLFVNGDYGGRCLVEAWTGCMKLGNSTDPGYVATGSDIRLKKEIVPIQKEYIDALYDLEIVNFYYKNDEENQRLKTGVIAQQVQETIHKYGIKESDYSAIALPSKEDPYYLIDYSAFIPSMIKAIQDQHQEIETLKTEIAEIKELLKNK